MSMRLWVVLSYLKEESNIEITFCFNELMVQFLTTILHVGYTVHEEQSVQYFPGVLSPLPGNRDTRKSLFLAKKHSIKTKHVFTLFLVHIKQQRYFNL